MLLRKVIPDFSQVAHNACQRLLHRLHLTLARFRETKSSVPTFSRRLSASSYRQVQFFQILCASFYHLVITLVIYISERNRKPSFLDRWSVSGVVKVSYFSKFAGPWRSWNSTQGIECRGTTA